MVAAGTGSPARGTTAGLGRPIVVLAVLVSALALVVWPLFGASVPLTRCGLGVLRFDDRKWSVVPAESFTRSTAPAHWQGHGVVTRVGADRLTYRDLSGVRLTFAPGDAGLAGCP